MLSLDDVKTATRILYYVKLHIQNAGEKTAGNTSVSTCQV